MLLGINIKVNNKQFLDKYKLLKIVRQWKINLIETVR